MQVKKLNRTVAARAALALLLGLAPYSIPGQSNIGTLRVAITDKASGKVVPAIVCITSLADKSWRVPPDGTIVSPHIVTSKEQIAGWAAGPGTREWSPGDIGPVRLTVTVPLPGIPLDQPQHDVYPVYAGLPAMPYWNEPVAYFVSKPFSITLPPGKWRLAVSRGVEYFPVFEEFTIAPRQKLERDVRLARWVDMRQQGWYSGDPEFHNWRDQPWRNEFILTWAEAQDIHMTSVLSYSKTLTEFGHPQMGYGKDFRYQMGDYALASGHEGPRPSYAEQGHLMQLNIKAAVRNRDQLMDKVCDVVHEQGGLCGYAHLPWTPSYYHRLHPEQDLHPGWDASINTIRGKIDFMEILQFRQLGVEDYYDFLNMGVKLTALAGSDVSGGYMLGESRVYAYTGRNFSVDSWYAAVKQGRTFVTNGPMLALTAGGAMPGDEVRVRKNANVRIQVRAWAPEAIGAPKVLEVLSQGRVIRAVESRDPKQSELTAEFELPAGESQWIVARTTTFNAAVAHTSPVYVIVDGASFADRAQLPQLVEKRLKVLDFIEKRLRDRQYTQRHGYSVSELPLLMESIQDARAKYKAVGQTR